MVTVLYLQQPKNKKMLSEELREESVSQDILINERKKFFDWGDVVAVAKVFPNDSREKDIIVFEVLTTKFSKGQGKHVLSPLLVLSSRVLIHM